MNENLFKVLSFFGAGIAVFFAFVNFGGGGILYKSGNGFWGFASIVSAIGWLVTAYIIYLNYQKTYSNKPGKKI